MGAKSDSKRNFESGVVTEDPELVKKVMDQFDEIWRGAFCRTCGRKEYCSDGAIE